MPTSGSFIQYPSTTRRDPDPTITRQAGHRQSGLETGQAKLTELTVPRASAWLSHSTYLWLTLPDEQQAPGNAQN
jgi:hypothetical protein